MSSLLAMNIRGVRSFASDTEQRIEFFKPLTVIVGPNGCGKTSTIECLRYATTGALPPGSSSGRAFVHDPKVEGETEVKASVKLLFETADKSKRYLAIRNMQLTQKKKTAQFKQIDGVLRAFDRSENAKTPTTEITQKCAQLNEVLPALLGISRSVLDNVIFCHQEDSTWPLAEGSILKKRFDDIFESTRYTKALEEIIKQKKVQINIGKDVLAEKMLSSEYHAQYLALQDTKDDLDNRLSKYSSNDKAQKAELIELGKEIVEKQKYMRKVTTKRAELISIKNELKLKSKEVDRHHENMSEEMDDSVESLENALSKFDGEAVKRRKQLRGELTSMETKNKKLKTLDKRLLSLNTARGEHQGAVQRANQHSKEHATLRNQLIEEYDLPPLTAAQLNASSSSSSAVSSNQDMSASKAILAALQDECKERKKILKENEKDNKKEYQLLQNELTKASGKVQVIKSQTDTKRKEKNALKKSRKNITDRLRTEFTGTLDSNKRKTQERTADVERALKKLDDFGKTDNLDEKRNKKSELRDEDTQLKRHEKKLRERQNTLLKNQSAVQALTDNKSKLSESKSDLDSATNDLVTKFEETFPSLEIERPDNNNNQQQDSDDEEDEDEKEASVLMEFATNVCDTIEENQHKLSLQLNHLEGAVRKLLTKLNKEEAKLSQKESQHQRVAQKVESAENEMKKELLKLTSIEWNDGEVDLSSDGMKMAQEDLENQLKDKQKTPGMVKAGKDLFERWIKVLKEKKEQEGASECECQACGRGIDDEDEYEEVLQKHLNWFERYKSHIESGFGTEDLDKLETELKEFRNIKDSIWQPWNIENQTIKKLDHEIKKLEKSKEEALKAHTIKNNELIEKSNESKKISLYRSECHTLKNHIKNMTGFMKQITKHRDMLPKKSGNSSASLANGTSVDDILSMDECEVQINKVEKERSDISDQLVALDRSLDEGMKQSKRLQDNLASSRNALQVHNTNIKDQENLDETLKQQNERDKQLAKEISDGDTEAKELRKIEIKHQGTLDAKSEEHEDSIKALKQRDIDCQTSLVAYKESHKRLEKNASSKSIENLNKCDQDIIKVENEKKEIEMYVLAQTPIIKDLERLCNDSSNQIKTINENIQWRQLQQELNNLNEDKDVRETEYASFDPKTNQKRLIELEKLIKALNNEMSKSTGSKDELKRQLSGTTRELKDKKFKNIVEKVRKLTIHHKTVEMAVKDLERYHGALDSALQSYHAIKVKEINMIIKEIWQICYKGGDVDMIELRSDPTKATATRARSYNYRVVMTKGTTELDMRGRCSAGQKQLASLVIRMALAETFCVNCGILALDEPTTNLDEENKRGLCEALSTIIDARMKQENFQLIVITHDEDFVRMLGRAQGDHPPEFFYALSRREQTPGSGHYISEIHKKTTVSLDDE